MSSPTMHGEDNESEASLQPGRAGSADPGEDERVKLEIQKLRLEVARLSDEGNFWAQFSVKYLPSFVSIVTMFVAVLGIVFSAWTLRQQFLIQKTDRHDKTLQSALQMATDPIGQADRRIAGIYGLEEFWAYKEDRQIIAATLSAVLLASDPKTDLSEARCAAAEVIGSAIPASGERGAAADQIVGLLFGNAKLGTLGLVSRENYRLRAGLDLHRLPNASNDDSATRTLTCATPLDATREAIRKNWANLRNTNLRWTDLSFTQLYQADLTSAGLYSANLVSADLRGANLTGVELTYADLAGADLTDATLTGAVLRCANLAGAHLSGAKDLSKANLTLANVEGLDAPDSPMGNAPLLGRAIKLSNDDWHKWKNQKFSGLFLKSQGKIPEWLKDSNIESVADICEGGRQPQ
jgi:uncharacterized protein YjbI with pentapeptide repeats